MNRRIFQLAILLLWVALPLVMHAYKDVWDQLPAHMATHFNAAGQANGWMPRDGAYEFGVGFMAFLLTIFSAILIYMSRGIVNAFSWAMLLFCTLITAVMVQVNRGLVSYNLNGARLRLGPILIAIPVAVIFLIGIHIYSHREPPLASTPSIPNDLLAEETSGGGMAALLFSPLVIAPAIAATLVSDAAVRFSMIFVSLVGGGVIAAAWSGFQYRFFRHGFEIWAMGFRLRSIPKNQLQSYAPETWSPLRGYGIRGIGNSRAYVWGNKVVHVKTRDGNIFIGHDDPMRIVRDLDRVMSS